MEREGAEENNRICGRKGPPFKFKRQKRAHLHNSHKIVIYANSLKYFFVQQRFACSVIFFSSRKRSFFESSMKQISGTDQTGHPQEEEHVADPLLDVDLSKLPFDLDEMQREQSSDLGKHVYIHHEELGYVRGKIVDIGAERLTVEAEGETVELPYGKVLPADPEGAKDVDDNCKF